MVAKAISRSTAARNTGDDDLIESGLSDKIKQQLAPLLTRLKNRWVILLLFIAAYIPFGVTYLGTYQDNVALQSKISAQRAVLGLPEPRTDDIETGLRSWTAALEAATQAQVLELPDSGLVERIISAANTAAVKIESLSTGVNDIVPVGSEIYEVTPVIMRVRGDISGVENFLALLEGDAVEAMEIKNSLVAPDNETYIGSVRALVFNRPVAPEDLTDKQLESLSRIVSDAELDAAAGGGKK
jgi:hypothetical protein